MNVSVEDLSAVKKRLKVEIPVEAINEAREAAYTELKNTVKVDGFRKGKAPRHILEKRYSESVDSDVLQKLVPDFYIKAVQEAKIHPVGSPNIEEGSLKLRKAQPLTFSATVEVRPEFELGEYKGIEVEDEAVEVTGEDMDQAIEEVRNMQSTLETVEEDRPAAKDDYVVIDFEGFVDGVAFEGGKANNYPLQLGSGRFIEGFEDQLIGVKKGDDKEINVKFPDEYKNDKLAGKDAMFKVKVNELKAKVLPELDDELAKDLNMGATLDEMKENIRQDILEAKKNDLVSKQKSAVIRQLADKHTFELPPSLVDQEFRAMLIHQHQEMLRAGVTPQQAGFDMKEFETRFRPVAEDRVKVSMIVSAIADKEGINAGDDDIKAFLAKLSQQTGKSVGEILEIYKKREDGLSELAEAVVEEKVFDLILENANKVAKSK